MKGVAALTIFDRLVSSLSTQERREMLDRIASSVTIPEYDWFSEDDPAIDLEASFSEMGLLKRLIIFLTALLTGREKLSVVEEYALRDLRRRVSNRLPHGLDQSGHQLKPGAAADFRELSEAAHVFSTSVGRVMGRERRAFIAFLAGLHAPEVQMRLIDETDPFAIGTRYSDMKDNDIRKKAINSTEEIMATLPPNLRQRIYTDVRLLHHLHALAGFPFDRIIGAFYPVAGGEPVAAPLNSMVDDLTRLAGVFLGFREQPSPKLFEALGIYHESTLLDRDDQEVERRVGRDIASFIDAYGRILAFRKAYPLVDMVRLAHQNIHIRPDPHGGGEDWFTQWKGFWKERIEASFRRFAYVRKVETLMEESRDLLELRDIKPFPGYPRSGLDGEARHGLSLGLANTFMSQVYKKHLAAPVAKLFRDGDFYKSENRTEMDRVYHGIHQAEKDLASLELRLQESGDLGQSFKRTKDGSMSPEAAIERRYGLSVGLDSDAAALLHRIVDNLRTLGEILQGVLVGTVGGRYDTISNLAELGGSKNPGAFGSKLEEVHTKVKSAAHLIADLQTAEALAGEAQAALASHPVER